MFDLIIHRLAT